MDTTAPTRRTAVMTRAEYERRLEACAALPDDRWIVRIALGVGALGMWGSTFGVAAGVLPRAVIPPGLAAAGVALLGLPFVLISRAGRRNRAAGLLCPECSASLVGTQTSDAVSPAGHCVPCGAAVVEPTAEVREQDARAAEAATRLPHRADLEPRLRRAARIASTRMGIAVGGLTLAFASMLPLVAGGAPDKAVMAAPFVVVAALVGALKVWDGARARDREVLCPGCGKSLLHGGTAAMLRSGRCTLCGCAVMRTAGTQAADPLTTPDHAERGLLTVMIAIMAGPVVAGFAPRGESLEWTDRGALPLLAVGVLLAWVIARWMAPRWWKDSTVVGRAGVLSFPAMVLGYMLVLNGAWINALLPPQTREVVQGRVTATSEQGGMRGRYVATVQVDGRAEPLELRVRRREFDAMKPGDAFRRDMVRGGLGLYYSPR